jgi:hypothetical protein
MSAARRASGTSGGGGAGDVASAAESRPGRVRSYGEYGLYLPYGLVQTVECPRCGAKAGFGCRNAWGRKVHYAHESRKHLAVSAPARVLSAESPS